MTTTTTDTPPAWSRAALTRLAYSAACRELSDAARGGVPTDADDYAHTGELVAEALRLRGLADEVLRLAVAYERARHTSWQELGDVLDTTKQAAHERFAAPVEEIADGILFPEREGPPGGYGWLAGPEGVHDPDATARALDAWEVRHREPIDPDRGENAVTAGLHRLAAKTPGIEAVAIVTTLARRVVDRSLPAGVSERAAQRTLLEAKIHAHLLVAADSRGERRREAAAMIVSAFEQLIEWHAVDAREDIGHVVRNDQEAVITVAGKSTYLLSRTSDPRNPEATGWWLWQLTDAVEDFRIVDEAHEPLAVALDQALALVAQDIAVERARAPSRAAFLRRIAA